MNRIENAKLKLLNQQTIRISIYLTLQRYIKNLTLPNNFMVIFRKSVPIAVKIIAAFIFDVYRPCEK